MLRCLYSSTYSKHPPNPFPGATLSKAPSDAMVASIPSGRVLSNDMDWCRRWVDESQNKRVHCEQGPVLLSEAEPWVAALRPDFASAGALVEFDALA